MSANLPLQIQTLGGFQEQTLILLHVASLQASNNPVTPTAVRDMFVKLRLPPPTNVSQHLGRLRQEQLAMQPSTALWTITPLGTERIRTLMARVSDVDLAALAEAGDAEPVFGEARHHLIPAELAPSEFQLGIGRFLEGHPFERNVFGISRFPRTASDSIVAALQACRRVCAEQALEFHLASDRTVEDYIPKNVAASIWACKYGIAILEDRVDEGLNYNVIFEVGAMLATGRRCLLLKDVTSPKPPTDLIGHIYAEVDIEHIASVEAAVAEWIRGSLAHR